MALIVELIAHGRPVHRQVNAEVGEDIMCVCVCLCVCVQVLNILEFNSTRKRMSVIVQDDKGRIILFCKVRDIVTITSCTAVLAMQQCSCVESRMRHVLHASLALSGHAAWRVLTHAGICCCIQCQTAQAC